jgi:hypothetical protein
MKFAPFTVNVNALPPTVVELGEMEDSDGTGFEEPVEPYTVKTTSTQ